MMELMEGKYITLEVHTFLNYNIFYTKWKCFISRLDTHWLSDLMRPIS